MFQNSHLDIKLYYFKWHTITYSYTSILQYYSIVGSTQSVEIWKWGMINKMIVICYYNRYYF